MIHDVVLTQQREWQALLAERFVPRTSVPAPQTSDLIQVVMGPRRAGKSMYAVHLGAAREVGCGYVNFDDERLVSVENTDALIAAVDGIYGNPKTLVLDEVQNLPRWELLANRLQRNRRRLILTGSNAHLLSSELATHLTGRHATIPLLPFSFAEYMAAMARTPATEVESAEACRQYALKGGFPEVLLKNLQWTNYLRTLVAAIVFKDIVGRYRLRAPQAVDALATNLLSQPGGEFSFRTLAHATGCRSPHTLQKYVGYLAQAFLVFTVPRFSFKVREQTASNKKAYPIDPGLVSAVGFSSSPNRGRLLETLVAIACFRRELRGEVNLFYWKDPQQTEVDFVLHSGNRVRTLIQVCVDPQSPKVREREVRGLLKASRDLRCEELLLLTDAEEGAARERWQGHEAEVRRQPVWKWLIAQG